MPIMASRPVFLFGSLELFQTVWGALHRRRSTGSTASTASARGRFVVPASAMQSVPFPGFHSRSLVVVHPNLWTNLGSNLGSNLVNSGSLSGSGPASPSTRHTVPFAGAVLLVQVTLRVVGFAIRGFVQHLGVARAE